MTNVLTMWGDTIPGMIGKMPWQGKLVKKVKTGQMMLSAAHSWGYEV